MNYNIQVQAQAGCVTLVKRHLDQLAESTVLSANEKATRFGVDIEADDRANAIGIVRQHLAPVCGVEYVE